MAQKKEDNMLGNVIERLQKMETFINSLSKPSETPNGDRAEEKVDRVADVIWAELNGTSSTNASAAISAIKRGVRMAMNEFYRGPYDRSDTAFKADQVELTSARNRILELEVQLNSSLEIEKSARLEHARISEELVREKEMHRIHIVKVNELQREIDTADSYPTNVAQQIKINELEETIRKNDREYVEALTKNDGLETTVGVLRDQLANAEREVSIKMAVIDNALLSLEGHGTPPRVAVDYTVAMDDGPNYAQADDDDDSDIPEMELRGS